MLGLGINDLGATGHSIEHLPPEEFCVLNVGKPEPGGTRALLAAGTGLGQSFLVWNGQRYQVVPSEGGHCDFGPRDAFEDELLHWLRGKYGRVSYERVLSGPGLADLYRFHRETRRGQEPAEIAMRFDRDEQPAAIVTETALDGSCERARLTLEREAPDNLASLRGFFTREPIAITRELLCRISIDGAGVNADDIRGVEVPTLIISHDRDAVHPLAIARGLAALIPSARLVTITPKAESRECYRDDFRAAPHSVAKMRALVAEGKVRLEIADLKGLSGADGKLSAVVCKTKEKGDYEIACDELPVPLTT